VGRIHVASFPPSCDLLAQVACPFGILELLHCGQRRPAGSATGKYILILPCSAGQTFRDHSSYALVVGACLCMIRTF
jgi:hypothetical protein